jgi:hypothetical protein
MTVMMILPVVSTVGYSVSDTKDRQFDAGREEADDADRATDYGQILEEQTKEEAGEGAVRGILSAFGIDYAAETDQTATFFVKNTINLFLAIVALVALIILIYGFYKMLSASDNKEDYNYALKVVK